MVNKFEKFNLDKNIKYEQLMAKIEVLEKIMKEKII